MKDKEENKNLFVKKNDDYKTSDYSNISKDILNSYNKAIDNIKADNTKKEDLNSSPVSRTDDVFAAFDKMLSSIISKAEEDAKRSITKNK